MTKTIPCINDSLVDNFGLKPDIRQSLPQIYLVYRFQFPTETLFNFDQANQQLNISIPQAWWRWHQKPGPPPHTRKKVLPGS
ncbi:FimD/PapC N-terminal domain-containing protein [Escherichia coli]